MAAKPRKLVILVLVVVLGVEVTLAKPIIVRDSSGSSTTKRELANVAAGEQRIMATEALDMLASSPKTAKRRNVSGRTQEGGMYTEYGSDADGEKGYAKKTFSNGDQGYKNYDTFHKKRGDSYGFEEHEAFGDARGKHKDAAQAASSKRTKHKDHVGAGSSAESYYAGENSSGGGAEYYSGEAGSGEASGYSEGDGDSYSEGGGDGSAEGYSSGEAYSSEDGSDY